MLLFLISLFQRKQVKTHQFVHFNYSFAFLGKWDRNAKKHIKSQKRLSNWKIKYHIFYSKIKRKK